MPRLVNQDVREASDLGLVKVVATSVHDGYQLLHVSPAADPSDLFNMRLDSSQDSDFPIICSVVLDSCQDSSDFPRVLVLLPNGNRLSGRLRAWACVRPIQS